MQYKVFSSQNLHSPPLSCSPKNTPHQSEYTFHFPTRADISCSVWS